MNEYEVQYYSNYHKTDLERERNKNREAGKLKRNQKQVEGKRHNPSLMMLINLLKL